MKWFHNISTLDELRTAYRKLAMHHHPDRGGNTSDMQEINAEYEVLSQRLINGNPDFSEGRKWYETKASADIREKINEIISIQGVVIEIIGSWIWVTGLTRPVKDQLKQAGFKLSTNKTAWYWQCGNYRKHNGNLYSMDEIREMWGAETVQNTSEKNRFLNH